IITSKKFNNVDQQIAAFNSEKPAGQLLTHDFSAFEWIRFLRGLHTEVPMERMKELDDAFHFSESGNSEVLFEWLQHVIASNYKPAYPALENFLINVGRRKFVKPLFVSMNKTG